MISGRLPEHQRDDVRPLRAECRPNANLARSLRDAVRQHAEEPGTGDERGDDGEG